ncbi:MAG: hypothetical protein ACXWC2_09835 [Ramlibacter sp.]
MPRTGACRGCRAQRMSRRGMTPGAFRVYAASWLACAGVVLLLALRIAAEPWLPTGEAPDYALWLLGASEAKPPPPACLIVVYDAAGRQIGTRPSDRCAGAPAGPPAAPAAAVHNGPLLRALACALHSLLALGSGLIVAAVLRNALRRLFRRPAGFAWVARARA